MRLSLTQFVEAEVIMASKQSPNIQAYQAMVESGNCGGGSDNGVKAVTERTSVSSDGGEWKHIKQQRKL
jgi:hypothetical protein